MPRKAAKTNVSIKNYDYYRVTAVVGKKADGSPYRKQFYAKNKKEALAKRDDYLLQIRQGLSPGFDKINFGTFFVRWYNNVLSPSLALTTLNRYEQELRLRITPSALMAMNLSDIKAYHIQGFYSALTSEGASINCIRVIHNMFSNFFNYCLITDLLIKNPLLAVVVPKNRQAINNNKKLNLSDEEIQRIVLHAQKHPTSFIFVFAIFTGLRQGEILALTYRDIKNNTINVSKTLHYLSVNGRYKILIAPTKTAQSIRKVPIFEMLLPMLNTHIAAEKEKHRKRGVPFNEDSILFSSSSCGYDSGRYLRRRLHQLYDKLNIEPTSFHGLRHTFCSALAKNNVSIKATSELMGHSNINTTLKIYTHVQEEEKHKSIASLSSVFPKE